MKKPRVEAGAGAGDDYISIRVLFDLGFEGLPIGDDTLESDVLENILDRDTLVWNIPRV
jgi:hypothetical protein